MHPELGKQLSLSADLFPLGVGNRWEYSQITWYAMGRQDNRFTRTIESTALITVDGQSVRAFVVASKSATTGEGLGGGFSGSSQMLAVPGDDVISFYAVAGLDSAPETAFALGTTREGLHLMARLPRRVPAGGVFEVVLPNGDRRTYVSSITSAKVNGETRAAVKFTRGPAEGIGESLVLIPDVGPAGPNVDFVVPQPWQAADHGPNGGVAAMDQIAPSRPWELDRYERGPLSCF